MGSRGPDSGGPGREDPSVRRPIRRAGRVRERTVPWATRVVVDASVAVKWILPERGSDDARRLYLKVVEGELQLLAPELLRVEVAGALLRSRLGDARLVEEEIREIEDIGIQYHPVSADLMVRAVRIAGDRKLQAADAAYAALAEQSGCIVVTADDEMTRRLAPTRLAVRLSALR